MCKPARQRLLQWARASPTHSAPEPSEQSSMTTSGTGIFYDGLTSDRRKVAVEIGGDAIEVRTGDGALLARWRFADISPLAAPAGVLRIGLANAKAAARLEIHLGAAVDTQVRQALGASTGGKPLECGASDSPRAVAARAALAKLVAALEAAAELPLPLRTLVVRRADVNAITLPGGRIYVFDGLLAKADSVDEVAGVLGHEIGHVAHRDGTKSVLEAAGLSLLFGMLLGDFTGGGAVIIAARTVLQTAYSRTAEAAADEFGARLMYKVGGDPQAIGAFLLRISGTAAVMPHFLLDHPAAQERADAIAKIAQPSPMGPLLSAPEWEALKTICTEG